MPADKKGRSFSLAIILPMETVVIVLGFSLWLILFFYSLMTIWINDGLCLSHLQTDTVLISLGLTTMLSVNLGVLEHNSWSLSPKKEKKKTGDFLFGRMAIIHTFILFLLFCVVLLDRTWVCRSHAKESMAFHTVLTDFSESDWKGSRWSH